MANDQAVKWAKAEVCVYADSVRVGQVKDVSGATERWKCQVEDLKKHSSYQDAVGLDGEPTDFEWKNARIFVIISSSRDPERLGDEEHQATRLEGLDHLHVNVQ